MLQAAAPQPAKSAAISSTPAKSAKAPKGVTLDRGEAVYDIAAAAGCLRPLSN
jgi:Tfp pilus assembly protein FimV